MTKPDFFPQVAQHLDRRLQIHRPEPIVVAFSGGGDSLALLLAADAWGRSHGRTVVAVTVDHQIQPVGATWARWCQTRAEALGVTHLTSTWVGEKPARGLAAAARRARHEQIAQIARSVGARVILMGHTADDLAEAAWMRETGTPVASPRLWSPVPFWPAGRGLFILRPLIELRRSDLRAALTQMRETWIEDPANDDLRALRSRARSALAGRDWPNGDVRVEDPAPLTLRVVDRGTGVVSVEIADLSVVTRAEAIRGLGAALICASGSERLARTRQLERLMTEAISGRPFSASLRGARAQSDGQSLWISREAGEFSRAATPDQVLSPGVTHIWDGRFCITSLVEGLRVSPLKGRLKHLPAGQKAALANFPPAVRASLPVLIDEAANLSSPVLAPDNRIQLECLVWMRFLAATGHIRSEADIGCVAKPEQRP